MNNLPRRMIDIQLHLEDAQDPDVCFVKEHRWFTEEEIGALYEYITGIRISDLPDNPSVARPLYELHRLIGRFMESVVTHKEAEEEADSQFEVDNPPIKPQAE